MNGFYELADFTDPQAWLTIGRVAGFIIGGYVLALWVALVYWTFKDVTSRTSDHWTQALGLLTVALFFIPGLLLYLALRPAELLDEAYSRRLEAEAFRHEIEKHPLCTGCGRPAHEEFIMCPYCRTVLRTACNACGEYLASAWIVCPFCASERTAPGRVASARGNNGNGSGGARRPATRPDQRPRPIRPQPTQS
ncbi:MAG TPA: zinc ribbon domain-containing protein [Dehalococcoidia bacterium]|jgi:RNA polymerase subunit RPABC4/transcription elongation factor Spt4